MTSPSPKKHPTTNNSTESRVAIFGAFDILHPGHLNFIKQALLLGQVHLVLARDKTILRHKGHQPYYSENERLSNLKKLGLNIKLHLGNYNDPYQILNKIKPQIVLLGADQKIFVNNLHAELARRNIIAVIKRADDFHSEYFKSSKINSSLKNPQAGFLFVNKPVGPTSHDIINHLRKICSTRKIGHAGTLDPLASGLLVCGLFEAKKQLAWWHLLPKTYQVKIELGKESDTYDRTGKITVLTTKKINQKKISEILPNFIGKQWQLPPPFSAKKIKGRKAYELARKGQAVKLKKNKITIQKLRLINFAYPQTELEITCSSGTYIRSLIHDLGKKLGSGAIMTELTRTQLGFVKIKQALTLEQLEKKGCSNYIYPVKNFLEQLNGYYLKSMGLPD